MALPNECYQTTYPEEDFARLCETYAIPGLIRTDVLKSLEGAAAVWRWYSIGDAANIPNSEAAESLRKVAKQASKLRKAIDELPLASLEILETETARFPQQAITKRHAAPEVPSWAILIPSTDSDESYLNIDLRMLRAMITALQEASADSANKLPKAPAGTKRDDALRMWMTNVADFWERKIERPFTRDVSETGEPVTEAARFCVDAYKFVDSQCPPSRVMKEMKACIKARRKRTGRISVKN